VRSALEGRRREARVPELGLAETQRGPPAVVVGAGMRQGACVERGAPRIAVEQELGQVSVREDRVVAAFVGAARQPSQEREKARALSIAAEHLLGAIA
jgi:hypothetical protein